MLLASDPDPLMSLRLRVRVLLAVSAADARMSDLVWQLALPVLSRGVASSGPNAISPLDAPTFETLSMTSDRALRKQCRRLGAPEDVVQGGRVQVVTWLTSPAMSSWWAVSSTLARALYRASHETLTMTAATRRYHVSRRDFDRFGVALASSPGPLRLDDVLDVAAAKFGSSDLLEISVRRLEEISARRRATMLQLNESRRAVLHRALEARCPDARVLSTMRQELTAMPLHKVYLRTGDPYVLERLLDVCLGHHRLLLAVADQRDTI